MQKQHALVIHQTHQKLSSFEDELAKKDEELSELKLAYKEKMRKCTAWEKITKTKKSNREILLYLLLFLFFFKLNTNWLLLIIKMLF